MVSKSKTKKKINESIKQEMLNLLKKNDDAEEQGKKYKDIIKTQNKKTVWYW